MVKHTLIRGRSRATLEALAACLLLVGCGGGGSDGTGPSGTTSASGSGGGAGTTTSSGSGSGGEGGGVAVSCTRTLDPGADVAKAIASAADATICLNAGSYGTVSLDGVVRANDVTVRSAAGRTASLDAVINQSSHVVFQSLTIAGLEIDTNQQGGTKNISVKGCTFTGQAVVNVGKNGDAGILFDGNTFDGIGVCADCYEGRLEIISNPWSGTPSGVTISNNHFGNKGESDGIQVGAHGVVIGPGNVFDGIVQANYARHVDAIQLYGQSHTTITGNYFVNDDTHIMAPDGGDTEIISNNVFVGGSYRPAIQLGSHVDDSFLHNTVIGVDVFINKKQEVKDKSANAVVRDNVLVDSSFGTTDSGGTPSCVGCTFDHNLFDKSGEATGTQNVFGKPLFVGGAKPSTRAGYLLQSTSPGHGAASDGKDMGIDG